MSSDLRDKLLEPFPPEALIADESRGFSLTSIKAQYVVERLNNVFGHGGWKNEVISCERIGEEVIIQLSLSTDKTNTVTQFGGSATYEIRSWADCYKSAATDALTKCASLLGIGNEIFKGNVPPPNENNMTKSNPNLNVEQKSSTDMNSCISCGVATKPPFKKCYRCHTGGN